MSLVRLTVLLLLLVPLVIFVGFTAAADAELRSDALDIELDDILVSQPQLISSVWALSSSILVLFKNQTNISQQILLGFFFYGWRNGIYRRWTTLFQFIIKPGMLRRFRLLYLSLGYYGRGKEAGGWSSI